MNKDRLFGDKTFYSKLTRLTLPLAFQSLMLAAVAAGDAIMLGRVEQNAMSAVSLATQIQFIQNIILSGIVSAVTSLGAQYFGKKDLGTMEEIFCMSLRVAGVLSLLFCLGCVGIPTLLMSLFTNEKVLIDIGAEYLRIAGWSYLLTGISQCYLAMMKVTDHPKAAAYISSVSVVVNILLNAVFIFGLFGLKARGSNGAAIATLLARIIELALAIGVSMKQDYLKPSIKGLFHRNKWLAKDFAKVSLPLCGAGMMWGVGFTSYTAVIGHMGTDAAAANSVSAVVRDLTCCLCNGISAAGGIVVGNELGRGDLAKGKLYGDRIMKISYVNGLLTTLVVLAVTLPVARYMILTEEARRLLYGMMIITSVYMIGRCVNTIVINGIFAAGGDTLYDMYSLAVCMWGLAVPLAFLGAFVFHWPVLVVYSCCCLDEVGKIPWVMLHYRKYKWVRDLTHKEEA